VAAKAESSRAALAELERSQQVTTAHLARSEAENAKLEADNARLRALLAAMAVVPPPASGSCASATSVFSCAVVGGVSSQVRIIEGGAAFPF
jgi:hypothetical protein